MELLQMLGTLFLGLEIKLFRRSLTFKAVKMNGVSINIALVAIISRFVTFLS
jgi:hypothetical protein